MNRKNFIHRLAGLAGLGWLHWAEYRSSVPAGYILYSGWVAGFNYYDGPEVVEKLKAGDQLQFSREPDNAYDERAIEVYSGRFKLGYIPRVDNHVLASMMDHGEEIDVFVEEVSKEKWEKVKVCVVRVSV